MRFLRTLIWLVAASAIFAVTSCDKIEGDFLEETGDKCGKDIANFPIRKILVEDFTGHTCGNCPRAAETVASLKDIYCDHIVTVAVHMGFFAETKNNLDTSYAYDFKSSVGNELDQSFDIDATGLPRGMINRSELDDKLLLAHAAWPSAVEALFSLPPDMDINMVNTYDDVSRKITTEVTVDYINTLSGTYNLVVLLTEDSITNWQKDYDLPAGQQDIRYYLHRHVLRKSFNSTWGNKIASSGVTAGQSTTQTYTMILPEDWVEDRCGVVAYVYETTSLEVVQAEESEVK